MAEIVKCQCINKIIIKYVITNNDNNIINNEKKIQNKLMKWKKENNL